MPCTGREPQRDLSKGGRRAPLEKRRRDLLGRAPCYRKPRCPGRRKNAPRRAPREKESRRAGGVRRILTRSALQRVSGGVSKRRSGQGSGSTRRTGRRHSAAAQREPHLAALVRGGVHAGTRLHGPRINELEEDGKGGRGVKVRNSTESHAVVQRNLNPGSA